MMIIQQQKKMTYIFAHFTPCQVAGRLMYHFLLLQLTSINISEKFVTTHGREKLKLALYDMK